MKLVQTKSFSLATYSKGDQKADKLILVLPGRLDTKDYPHMRSHVDHFAQQGYLAVSFDPPGTWESPGEIELYTMTNYLKAINELIEYFGNKPTILIGHSRGGSMAMLAGAQNSYVTHIGSVFSWAKPSEVEGKVENGYSIEYRETPPNDSTKMVRFNLPLAFFHDAQTYDVEMAITNCAKPKLWFYSKKDIIVSGEHVVETFEKSIEPKLLHELHVGHDYRKYPKMIKEVETITGEFIVEYAS